MRRLLVVPSTYSQHFRVRNLEFAARWARHYEVYVWRWHWLAEVKAGSPGALLVRRAAAALADLTRRLTLTVSDNGLHLVDAPFLHPSLFRRLVGLETALNLSRRFNGRQLKRAVYELNIDRVVLASAWFDLPTDCNVPVFYDVVDWFNEDSISPDLLRREMTRFRRVLSRTTANFAVSIPLVQKLGTEHGITSRYLPNGVDLQALRRVHPTSVDELRRRLSLEGRWVLGYIGNHDAHSGLDFLMEVFKALFEISPDVALVIVGPCDYWKRKVPVPEDMPVHFTGPLPATEIPLYCHLQDISVHPCEKSQFRDYALPLKVVEASAARKHVVSTDLLTLRGMNLPNVWLVERNVEAWVQAILALRSVRWDPAWDRAIEALDWNALADTSADWISGEQDALGLRRGRIDLP